MQQQEFDIVGCIEQRHPKWCYRGNAEQEYRRSNHKMRKVEIEHFMYDDSCLLYIRSNGAGAEHWVALAAIMVTGATSTRGSHSCTHLTS